MNLFVNHNPRNGLTAVSSTERGPTQNRFPDSYVCLKLQKPLGIGFRLGLRIQSCFRLSVWLFVCGQHHKRKRFVLVASWWANKAGHERKEEANFPPSIGFPYNKGSQRVLRIVLGATPAAAISQHSPHHSHKHSHNYYGGFHNTERCRERGSAGAFVVSLREQQQQQPRSTGGRKLCGYSQRQGCYFPEMDHTLARPQSPTGAVEPQCSADAASGRLLWDLGFPVEWNRRCCLFEGSWGWKEHSCGGH